MGFREGEGLLASRNAASDSPRNAGLYHPKSLLDGRGVGRSLKQAKDAYRKVRVFNLIRGHNGAFTPAEVQSLNVVTEGFTSAFIPSESVSQGQRPIIIAYRRPSGLHPFGPRLGGYYLRTFTINAPIQGNLLRT